ncbi:ribosome recycling factor [Treponema sp. OMZ 857]|uniref:ribosome recycling factor n=1 Tax=Treponema sp. OMZ 857 TaxID=1643513 RepID=UPI0020A537A6|nr:ribosome recycling factor [Treponema sp. OMZ 857]UTC43730.1 ribosome recycling factor [Treponema sp. OMZ 857]
MSDIHSVYEEKMKKSIVALKDDFNALRTGRASASLFDKIRVDCYGESTPLNQVAGISIPEARLVVIQPWDKSLLGEIEKAILKSELSLNPANDGKLIRIAIPPLTEERRKELAKQAKNFAEQCRVAIRNIRRDGIDEAKKQQKDGLLSEDALKAAEEKFQKATDAHINDINKLLAEKEKEIMEG